MLKQQNYDGRQAFYKFGPPDALSSSNKVTKSDQHIGQVESSTFLDGGSSKTGGTDS